MSEQTSYVIIGGGLTGAKAAEAVREADADARVTLVGDEGRRPYERPELSKGVLLGKKTPDDLFVHDEGWYAEHDVDLLLGRRATAIDREAGTVRLEDGESLTYDRLLLATGARPRTLNVPGADLDGVLYLRRAEDSDVLVQTLGSIQRLVVVGGGWIGLEVAAAAREKGVEVTVVEPQQTPLMGVVGPEVGEVWAQLHRGHGVDVRSGTQVNALQGDGRVDGVVLGDGTVLAADAVVVGVGAVPNLELAADAGFATDGGLKVDRRLRTEDPRIWAAGDIALADNAWAGRRLRVEHWANAQDQGAFAGRSMAGATDEWAKVPYFYTDQYDAGMEYRGMADPRTDRLVLRGRPADGEYIAFWLGEDGAVKAGMHVNRWDDASAVSALVKAKAQVDPDVLADVGTDLSDVTPAT